MRRLVITVLVRDVNSLVHIYFEDYQRRNVLSI